MAIYNREQGFQSYKLELSVKQSLKFLDTLGLSLENEEMFHAGESHQVAETLLFNLAWSWHNPLKQKGINICYLKSNIISCQEGVHQLSHLGLVSLQEVQ